MFTYVSMYMCICSCNLLSNNSVRQSCEIGEGCVPFAIHVRSSQPENAFPTSVLRDLARLST